MVPSSGDSLRENKPLVDFFGVSIIDESDSNFLERIVSEKRKEKSINIMALNLTSLERFTQEMYSFSKIFEYTVADGNGLVRMSRYVKRNIVNQISLSTLSEKILKKSCCNGKKVFLLGATKKINLLAVANVKTKYPGIRIFGHHGYFDENNMDAIINVINVYAPDFIFVGISSPKKERVMLKISKSYTNSINIAVGGFIDILAGKTKRAPRLIQKCSLEWVYRFFQEPKRMFFPMIHGGFFFLFKIFPQMRKEAKKEFPSTLDIIIRSCLGK